ncbi:response regulator aspartate phosphatase [Bacillus sp. JCM 19046]|nr:response regulator aspartate phosphatase [Bacillus sp. JCM 19045]GAF18830.1 response regulator aspartate phosphatase [Bacillus sp. JCM 19046]
MNLLAPEKVGGKIVEWHSCLMAKDIESAKAAREQALIAVEKMKPDDKMLAYYQLISMRHDLLTNQKNAPEWNEIEWKTEEYLYFMYYYVSGQNEFLHGRYKSAIRTFKIAERLIEQVNDPSEKAEFYQKLGISYYRIDQYSFASSYIEQALEFFEKQSLYKENELVCKMVLAAIESELSRFDSAESLFKELIELSKPYPFRRGLIFYNMGMNRLAQKQLEAALSCMEQALSIPEHAKAINGIKSRFYVANIRLRLGLAVANLSTIETEIKKLKLDEFSARSQVVRGLYLDNNLALVESGIKKLEDNQLFFECSEVCEEVAQHFELKGDFSTALHYSKLAIAKKKHQTIMGIEKSS